MRQFCMIIFLAAMRMLVWGQEGAALVGMEQNLQQLATLSPFSAGARSFDNRYEGVKGTPYAFEGWREARILIKGQEAAKEGHRINLDLQESFLLLDMGNNTAGRVPAEKLSRIWVEDQVFIVLAEAEVEQDQSPASHFYSLLHEGAFTLLRQDKKVFVKANYQGAYSPDRRYDEFVDESTYFLKGPQGHFQKVKLKQKAFEKALPEYGKAIGQYSSELGLKLADEASAIRLLATLERGLKEIPGI